MAARLGPTRQDPALENDPSGHGWRPNPPDGDTAAVEAYDASTYGERFADVYDDWYASITDTDACIATVADLATGRAGDDADGDVLELEWVPGTWPSRSRPGGCGSRGSTPRRRCSTG